jgi:hypothetical protein
VIFWWAGKDIIAFSIYGDYFYWATRDQYQNKGTSLYVIDVPGVKKLRKTVKDAKIIVIALFADYATRKSRLIKRDIYGLYAERVKRAEERLKYDAEAFCRNPLRLCCRCQP